MPVAAPIGFSGDFSSVLASVVSAQRFSESDGWRPSKTSAIGLSATPLGSFFLFTKSAIEVSTPIIEMRKMLGKSYSSGNYRIAFSVRLFGFCRCALAQYGLQLVAG